jgi:hypothetical protein
MCIGVSQTLEFVFYTIVLILGSLKKRWDQRKDTKKEGEGGEGEERKINAKARSRKEGEKNSRVKIKAVFFLPWLF